MAFDALIALDARITPRWSVGMQRYARELVRLLPREAPDVRFRTFEQGGNFGADEQLRLPIALQRARPRIVHHLSLYAPLIGFAPTIVTIHDLIHLRYPESFKKSVGFYYRTVVRALCARATRVITDDAKTIADLERYLGVRPRKVRVVPLGIGSEFTAKRFAADPDPAPHERPYLLYAGNHRPHKDLPTLFAAWNSLPDGLPHDLVLTGADDIDSVFARERPNGAKAFFIGEPTDERLAVVMAEAAALVYPSLCEGFGLPMLEALAVGTPVIASDAAAPGVLREQIAAFAAGDVPGLARRIVERPAAGLGDRAARRAVAAGLSWEVCARATADVYREVLAEGSLGRRRV